MEIKNCWEKKTIAEEITLFQEFTNVFSYNYHDLKGIPKEFIESRIELKPNANPIRQHPYKMDPWYKEKWKEELDKIMKEKIIYEAGESEWVSQIVITNKMNEKLRICIQFHKLNWVTIKDPFPTLFLQEVLKSIPCK